MSEVNQGFALDFTLQVLIGATESTTDKNVVTKSWKHHSHRCDLSTQEILLFLMLSQKFCLSHFL